MAGAIAGAMEKGRAPAMLNTPRKPLKWLAMATTAPTAIVDGESGARPADQLARAAPGDQGLGGAAGMTGGGVGPDVAVAGGADGADGPAGLGRPLFAAAAAVMKRQRSAAGADRLAG